MAAVRVVTRKTWTTWKMKYDFSTNSSIMDSEGTPDCLATATNIRKNSIAEMRLTSQNHRHSSHQQ